MQMHLRTSRDLLILVTNGLEAEEGNTVCAMNGGVAEWLRCNVSNLVGSIRVGSNPNRQIY